MVASTPTIPGRWDPHRPGPSARQRRLRANLTVLSFMAPALAGITIFLIYPLLSAVYFSLNRFSLLTEPEWVGLRNYRAMLTDSTLREAAYNTAWLVVIMVPCRVLAAIGAGTLLTKIRRGTGVYRTIFYLPALAPPVAATLAFVFMFKPGTGPVNTILSYLHVSGPLWFNDPHWSKPSLVLLALWGVGDITILFLAALLDVPNTYYEAADIDGASAWQKFRYITLPSIQPVIIFAAVTGVIQTLQYFTQAAVAASIASGQATTGGGISTTFGYPQHSTFTYPLWLYVVGFQYNALGYANALAVVLFVVAFAATTLMLRRSFRGEASR
jgi:multiple sugar transport system permease protein